jgi:benzoate membrane transport protein
MAVGTDMARIRDAAVFGGRDDRRAFPLFAVTMASQNVPGVATLRAEGYAPPLSPIITTTGIATTLPAPSGGYAPNLAAITAAIGTGRDAHDDPGKR